MEVDKSAINPDFKCIIVECVMLPFSYAIRNLLRDPARLAQTVGGAALVVLLLMAAMALNIGMDGVLRASGSEDNVILLGKGSEESIERSEVHRDVETFVTTGVKGIVSMLGQPAVSGEIAFMAPVATKSAEGLQAIFRGVNERVMLVRDEVVVVEGRFPGPGEVMVGTLAYSGLGVKADDLAVGEVISFSGEDFDVA
ncbi:MAG: hypothetical protein AAF206_21065 [Bacteroidota bacterium]